MRQHHYLIISQVKREKITWPGATIMKKGEGMANFENRHKLGNLYLIN